MNARESRQNTRAAAIHEDRMICTREHLDTLSDQLTDIRCAIRDAFETAHGKPLLDYAVDCVMWCEEIVAEIRDTEAIEHRNCAEREEAPERRRSSDWPIDEASHDVIDELRGKLDKAETRAGEAMERENAAIAQRDDLAELLRQAIETRAFSGTGLTMHQCIRLGREIRAALKELDDD